MSQETLDQIRNIANNDESCQVRAGRIATLIMDSGKYRWVGIYDVGREFVSIIAWAGAGPPAFPTFAVGKGLTGAAIIQKATIIVGDVSKDSRYLTAFGSTASEIIIPVIDPRTAEVVGTIDVESEKINAFSDDDQHLLQQCAAAALAVWLSPHQVSRATRRT
jgi:putative methionine-R-sulfoxide reductase with GAF domain